MKAIQILLLTGFIILSLIFLFRFRKNTFYLFLLSLLVCISSVFIIWPDITNKIANLLGVGRGSDLVFYFSILLFWFISLYLLGRIRKLEHMITEMIRNEAIKNAKRISADDVSQATQS